MNRLLHIFANRRMAALTLLGFASGIPYVATTDVLQAWLKDESIDIATIGLFGLLTLPYTLKFLWAPVMDRYVPPLLGRRRGWLLLTQILLIMAVGLLAIVRPSASIQAFAVITLVIAFFSASQDIVGDAYRTDVLPAEERGVGAAVWVSGYRIAMIVVGGGALVLAGAGVSWNAIAGLVAALLAVGVLGTFIAPEPLRAPEPPPTLASAVAMPLKEFLSRSRGWLVLLFIILFTLPDVMARAMTLPFMLDIGISKTDIGTVRQGLGVAITLVGAFFGGGIIARIGLLRSLWVFGLLQAFSNLGFWVLAKTGPEYGVMVGVIVIENFCAGMVTAGFVAFLMSQCDARFSATQFALLSSLMRITGVIGGAPTGFLVNHVGWSWFFALSVVAALPGLILLLWLRPSDAAPEPLPDPRGFEIGTPKAARVGLDP